MCFPLNDLLLRFIFRQLSPVLRKGEKRKKHISHPSAWAEINTYCTRIQHFIVCASLLVVFVMHVHVVVSLFPLIFALESLMYSLAAPQVGTGNAILLLCIRLYTFPLFPFIFAVGRFLISASLSLSPCTSRRAIKAFTNHFVKKWHCCFN